MASPLLISKVLTFDPSLRAFGWSFISNGKLIDCGCIETDTIKGILKGDSDTQRIQTIAVALIKIIKTHKPDLIVFENPIGSKSARAIQALSFAKAISITVSCALNIPVQSIKAREAKEATTSNNTASKEDILKSVQSSFQNFDNITKSRTKVQKYASSDAIAVYIGYRNQQNNS